MSTLTQKTELDSYLSANLDTLTATNKGQFVVCENYELKGGAEITVSIFSTRDEAEIHLYTTTCELLKDHADQILTTKAIETILEQMNPQDCEQLKQDYLNCDYIELHDHDDGIVSFVDGILDIGTKNGIYALFNQLTKSKFVFGDHIIREV